MDYLFSAHSLYFTTTFILSLARYQARSYYTFFIAQNSEFGLQSSAVSPNDQCATKCWKYHCKRPTRSSKLQVH